MKANFVLFDDFETLDVFGPAEVIGKLDKMFDIEFYSQKGGIIKSLQNVRVETMPFSEIKETGIIVIPGGYGTRKEVDNTELINTIAELSGRAVYVLTVCTGVALLAKTGLLNGRKATTNKLAFDWVTAQGPNVNWIRKARWVNDGKFYSSAGISAGIDMTLGFVSDRYGKAIADKIAKGIEYVWNSNPEDDPFA